MIVYDLSCDQGHRFEGWFGSSSDFADQQARGLVCCPECGSPAVDKAPMAPAVPAKANSRREVARASSGEQHPVSNTPMPAEVQKALAALADAQAKALKQSTWVGDKFAEQSRAMHYGERDEKPIHGRASAEEARGLIDEGIAVAPLPFPVSPPEELN
ncbi:DUF1178 family protein [Altererythrobacter arenosus]|uniref:DUF1178 family protein n=1 Tax=Altererythrobacter arenosus TaxID=3032592 RepID=A0ABY8FQ16_9SPHN|nr:DUF1178 family protein [Altererythrobacter sp. CAU 1644]WFL77111.1 DUF1178 family protein [Altererythrobacter sp. CAU 1644]